MQKFLSIKERNAKQRRAIRGPDNRALAQEMFSCVKPTHEQLCSAWFSDRGGKRAFEEKYPHPPIFEPIAVYRFTLVVRQGEQVLAA